jgi:hypothetical protein
VNQSNPFSSSRRVNPIYFSHPQESHEDIKVELPAGMQVEALPPAGKSDRKALYYELPVSPEGNALRIRRTLRFRVTFLSASNIPLSGASTTDF